MIDDDERRRFVEFEHVWCVQESDFDEPDKIEDPEEVKEKAVEMYNEAPYDEIYVSRRNIKDIRKSMDNFLDIGWSYDHIKAELKDMGVEPTSERIAILVGLKDDIGRLVSEHFNEVLRDFINERFD